MKKATKRAIDKNSYIKVANKIKAQIKTAQYKAVLTVNQELIRLYWNIGTMINSHAVWGNKFIEKLADDIKREFPETTGYSVRNLKYMSRFAHLFTEDQFVQAPLAQFTQYCYMTVETMIIVIFAHYSRVYHLYRTNQYAPLSSSCLNKGIRM